jgi:hypothetical protein
MAKLTEIISHGLTSHTRLKISGEDIAREGPAMLRRAARATERQLTEARAWGRAVLRGKGIRYNFKQPNPCEGETLAWYAWEAGAAADLARFYIKAGNASMAARKAFRAGRAYGVGQFKQKHGKQAQSAIRHKAKSRKGNDTKHKAALAEARTYRAAVEALVRNGTGKVAALDEVAAEFGVSRRTVQRAFHRA